MSREAKIRATAAAMHPKAIDLAAMRQRSVRDTDFRVRPEIAAGALAYASNDSDALPSLMLRLKHARWRTPENYRVAGELLLHRYKGLACVPSRTMRAVAMAALYEWVNDHCAKCRDREEPTPQPSTCECVNRKEERRSRTSPSVAWSRRVVSVGFPLAGCAKCGGSGRIFDGAKRERGIRCLSCNSTGRITFDPRKRARMVSELVAIAQKDAGEKVTGFSTKKFGSAWHAKYWKFVDVLRMIDKHEVGVLAFGFKPSHTAPIETESIDEVSMEAPE
jgi:hypothetical protein